jgi:tRNA-modifying protein YgfZ
MIGERATKRVVYSITGADRVGFLQGLITNDIGGVSDGLVYTALLTPQGKYLADFFLSERGDAILLDVDGDAAPALVQRLTMYKLRADVAIEQTALNVLRGLDDAPVGSFPDPRHSDLGWRMYSATAGDPATIDWEAIRVAHCIPETGIELIANDSYILEVGFERLSGVDFKKGCYVGQEVTARMKHKTELRKGLARVAITGAAPIGSEILSNGKVVGTLFTQSGTHAIAYLRFERAGEDMTAGAAKISFER